MLSRLVIAFLPRSKCLLISWLQSRSEVILKLPKIKCLTVSIVFPSICHEVMRPDAMILVFWMLSFTPTFSLSSFTFLKRLFCSSSLSVIRVLSSAYLRLLIFHLEILIPPCASSSPAFSIMYSAYKLNKQGDNIQPWRTPFPIWNQSVVPCPVLTVASWPAYRFLRRQVRWAGIPISWWKFSTVCCHPHCFGIVNKAKVDVFLELSCFFNDPTDVSNLISGSSAFSKSSLNLWKFTVHVLWKPGLENFDLYFTSKWDDRNCVVVWAFLGICLSLGLDGNWPFPVLWPLLSFQICWHIECSSFTSSSFMIWSRSTGIASPLLALFEWWFLSPTWLHIPGCLALADHTIVVIWVRKIFFGQFSCVFLPPLLNIFCSVRSIPFLPFIVPIFAWNVPLISLISLKGSLVFPILLFSSIFCIDHWGRLSYLSLLFFRTLHSNGHMFPFLLCFYLLFFSQLFVKPPQTTILPFFISFSWEWSWSLTPVQYHESPSIVFWMWTSVHSSSGTLSIRSNSLNLFVTSTI